MTWNLLQGVPNALLVACLTNVKSLFIEAAHEQSTTLSGMFSIFGSKKKISPSSDPFVEKSGSKQTH